MWWKLRPLRVAHTAYRAMWWGSSAVAWQILFMFVPLTIMISTLIGQAGWEYIRQLLSPVYLMVLVRSTLLATFTNIGCLALAYPLAYFLVFKAGRARLLGLFLIVVPFGINFLLHIYGWFFVIDRPGIINTVLIQAGVIAQPFTMLNTIAAVCMMMVYYYVPFMILPLYTQFEKIDPRLFQASSDLGATWWQTIRYILLPLSMPGVILGSLLVFVPAFGEFAIPEMMGGDRFVWVGSVIAHLVLGPDSMPLGIAFTVISAAWLGLLGLILWSVIRIWSREDL